MFVGYSLEQKGYKCFNPSTKKVRVSRDVVFDESASWYATDSTPSDQIESDFDIDTEEEDRLSLTSEESPTSARLSGPQVLQETKACRDQVQIRTPKVRPKCLSMKTQKEMNLLTHSKVSMVYWMCLL